MQTLLILAQLFALLIGAVSTLCAAAQALEARLRRNCSRFSLWLCARAAAGRVCWPTAFFGMDVLLARIAVSADSGRDFDWDFFLQKGSLLRELTEGVVQRDDKVHP